MSMNKTTLIITALVVASLAALYYKTTYRSNTLISRSRVGQTEDALVIGINPYPPYVIIDNNDVTGFEAELIKEIGQQLNKKVEFQNMAFTSLVASAQAGTIHAIACGIAPTAERAEKVLFTKPYVSNDPLVILTLKSHAPIRNVQDLLGKKVVVNQGYTADMFISSIPGMNIMRLDEVADGFMALQSGQADAFVTARSSAQPYFNSKKESTFSATEIPGSSESIACAVSKAYPQLHSDIERALEKLQKNGTLDALKKKWNL